MIISNTSKSIPIYEACVCYVNIVCERWLLYILLILRETTLRIAYKRTIQALRIRFKTFSQVFELIIRLIAGKQKQAIMSYKTMRKYNVSTIRKKTIKITFFPLFFLLISYNVCIVDETLLYNLIERIVKMEKLTAIYVRVSSNPQSTRSQLPDLKRYVAAYVNGDSKVRWYTDKMTGRSMDRPNWNKVQKHINNNKLARLIVWRIDRLGRTARGLTKLFDELKNHKVKFISVKEGIDLGTASGRLIANVMASVANYEVEVSSERIRAGQKAAQDAGKKWGGSKKGRLNTITREQARAALRMKDKGQKVSEILRTLKMNATTYYRIVKRNEQGLLNV